MAEPTTKQRKMFATMGIAMPDGSYYIRNGSDLQNAIDSVGRGSGDHDAIRKHIIARAKALHLDAKIPANWNSDGSMKQSDPVMAFLAHYGVVGMRWDHHVAQPNAPFIQRGRGQQAPLFTPQQRADKLAQLMQLIKASQAKATDQSAQEAKDNPSPAADAAHQANMAHLAKMAAAAKDVQATNDAHKAANAAKPANHPANQAHAANLKKKVSAAAAAHKAHVAKNGKKASTKGKGAAHKPTAKNGAHHPAAHKPTTKNPSVKSLSPKDKAALAKLSPAERHSLAILTPAQRKTLANMSEKDKKALSGLSQKQKDALAKATAASASKRHKEVLARKAGSVQHSDPVGVFLAQFGVNMDELAHHGVKGMHWGVRRNGGHPGAYKAKVPVSSSEDHQQTALIKSKVKVHGGIHALSNDELETVNKRLNLEQNYHRLTAQPAHADRGRSFVKKAIADAKTGIDLYNTINQVGKIATDIHSETKKRQGHQSRRTRNAPLRVVSIK